MAQRKFLLIDPAKPEQPSNAHTLARIETALVAVMAAGDRLNHDAVAEAAQVSRRTVYRYFPDQQALRTGLWKQLTPARGMPESLEELLDGLVRTFTGFDDRADAMTVAMASAEGRAMRNAMTPNRVAAYRNAFAEATKALSEPDRSWAIAAIQLVASGFAWREMRDQWGMTGEQIATASRWAIEAMLADLKRRGGMPLSEGAAP